MKHQLTAEGKERLPDLARFGKHLLASGDIDPIYPILRALHQERRLDEERAMWHSFLYVAWYHLPVGHAAFDMTEGWPKSKKAYGKRIVKAGTGWPTGIERRSNRGGRVFTHIEAFCQVTSHLPLSQWFRNGFVEAPTLAKRNANWRMLNERLQSVWGNGRWAAYKHCEVLRRVHDLPVEAPDMGHRFSSGPREGLATLYGPLEGQGEAVIAVLDGQGRDLQERLEKRGLTVDVEELETILCNWKSLLKGKYYVGHDIAELQEQIEQSEERGIINSKQAAELWGARQAALPHEYLGELNGRKGISKKRMVAYRDRRKILVFKPTT